MRNSHESTFDVVDYLESIIREVKSRAEQHADDPGWSTWAFLGDAALEGAEAELAYFQGRSPGGQEHRASQEELDADDLAEYAEELRRHDDGTVARWVRE